MPTKQAASAPWQDLEKQAYHAYREWHLWLALRERELANRSPNDRHAAGRTDKRAPSAAPAVERPERKTIGKEGAAE